MIRLFYSLFSQQKVASAATMPLRIVRKNSGPLQPGAQTVEPRARHGIRNGAHRVVADNIHGLEKVVFILAILFCFMHRLVH
jgi:hypothetical protein